MTYLSEVIADTPVHYWRLDAPGGVTFRDRGSAPWHFVSTPATASGYAGPCSDGGAFDASQAAQFMSTNNFIPSTASPFALEAWVWLYSHYAAETGVLIDASDGSVDSSLFFQNGKWGFFYKNAGATFTVPNQLQTWHHIFGVWDGFHALLYVDGVLAASAFPSVWAASTLRFTVGRADDGTRSINGFISEVAVYAHDVSAARIGAHYNAADQTSALPESRLWGSPSTAGGTPVALAGEDLALILQSVRRTYP